jgi:uncharacterized membrane protein YhiD involved in acid resistance
MVKQSIIASWQSVVIAIPVSLLLGLAIAILYKKVIPGFNYTVSILHTIIYLAMIAALVMIVIANEIARAFALVGALAVIRFRTPIKDARDASFIFFALAAGMGVGVGLYLEAILGTALIGFFILLIYYSRFGLRVPKEILVRFIVPMNDHEKNSAYHQEIFDRFLHDYKLLNTRSLHESQKIELVYLIQPLKSTNLVQFSQALSSVPQIEKVSVMVYEDEDLSKNVV